MSVERNALPSETMDDRNRINFDLLVDQSPCHAGEVATGRVHLALQDDPDLLQQIRGINILLEGYEHVEVQQRNINSAHENPVIQSSTQTLVKTEYPLMVFHKRIRAGRYEYPFRWKLPEDLPSTMQCSLSDNNDGSFVEIRYTLTAYILFKNAMLGDEPQFKSSTALKMAARCSPGFAERRPIELDETFPVETCCFWNNGWIRLGWEAETNTASPDSTVTILLSGENQSDLEVDHIFVKWIEIVTFQSGPDQRRVSRRVLASTKLFVNAYPWWLPQNKHITYYHALIGETIPDDEKVVEAQIRLPVDARETYSGFHVTVDHHLLVGAKISGDCITQTPCLTSAVQVENASWKGGTKSMSHTVTPVVMKNKRGKKSNNKTNNKVWPVLASQVSDAQLLLPENWEPYESTIRDDTYRNLQSFEEVMNSTRCCGVRDCEQDSQVDEESMTRQASSSRAAFQEDVPPILRSSSTTSTTTTKVSSPRRERSVTFSEQVVDMEESWHRRMDLAAASSGQSIQSPKNEQEEEEKMEKNTNDALPLTSSLEDEEEKKEKDTNDHVLPLTNSSSAFVAVPTKRAQSLTIQGRDPDGWNARQPSTLSLSSRRQPSTLSLSSRRRRGATKDPVEEEDEEYDDVLDGKEPEVIGVRQPSTLSLSSKRQPSTLSLSSRRRRGSTKDPVVEEQEDEDDGLDGKEPKEEEVIGVRQSSTLSLSSRRQPSSLSLSSRRHRGATKDPVEEEEEDVDDGLNGKEPQEAEVIGSQEASRHQSPDVLRRIRSETHQRREPKERMESVPTTTTTTTIINSERMTTRMQTTTSQLDPPSSGEKVKGTKKRFLFGRKKSRTALEPQAKGTAEPPAASTRRSGAAATQQSTVTAQLPPRSNMSKPQTQGGTTSASSSSSSRFLPQKWSFRRVRSDSPVAPDDELIYGELIYGESSATVDELQNLTRRCPVENLYNAYKDPKWRELFKRLSPREYCTTVEAAGKQAPKAAHALALSMGNAMTSRHILACLYTLHEPKMRLEVLRRTTILASDLPENQAILEQELNPEELAHVHAALEEENERA